jgi:glycine dehydrogenase
VIQRNILENPGWYTQYTPYQAEIAQGRLEALLNFQTMVMDLTGMDIANASLLDEGTAAAEAMTMCKRAQKRARTATPSSCRTSATRRPSTWCAPAPNRWATRSSWATTHSYDFGNQTSARWCNTRTPTAHVRSHASARAHAAGALVVVATDLLALTLLRRRANLAPTSPSATASALACRWAWRAARRVHAPTRDDLKRIMPGRLIGVSVDAQGNPAMRLSLQTREQHIRREKATSNICTAQVLLAVMASMYAVYHGPDGLRASQSARIC